MAIPTITTYAGGIPSRSGGQTQEEFSANGDDILNYMGVIAPNINAMVTETNIVSAQVDADKVASAASAVASAASAAAALASENQAASDAASANGNPLGAYANGITFNSHNDYVSESGLFRLKADVNAPYTTNTTTYPLVTDDPNLAPWSDVSELQSIARSLNQSDADVGYGDAGLTVKPILYAKDQQVVYSVPAAAIGKTIDSVIGSILKTSDLVEYQLESINKSDLKSTLAEAVADTSLLIGDSVRVTDRADGIFDVVLSSTITANGANIVTLTSNPELSIKLRSTSMFLNIKHFGADGTQAADTLAFYSAFDLSGYIDLQGMQLNVATDPRTIDGKGVYIKSGGITWDCGGVLLIPFYWKSGNLFRLERLKIVGDSNGTIDDSFDTTTGTYALVRATLLADGAAKNFILEDCEFERLIVAEDDKNGVSSVDSFYVIAGRVNDCNIHDIPGHAFGFNAWSGIDIRKNRFTNIGALGADFAAICRDCSFDDNVVLGASGVAKVQDRHNNSEDQIPFNCSISENRVVGLTGGTGGQTACIKLAGDENLCVDNKITYDGQTGTESIEIAGSSYVGGNKVVRTINKARGYISILNLVTANPKITIEDNRGSGHNQFAYLRNTTTAKISILNNTGLDDIAQLMFADTGVVCPNLKIHGNDFDNSAFVSPVKSPIQFSSGIVDPTGLSVKDNNIVASEHCVLVYKAEGMTISGNHLTAGTGNPVTIGGLISSYAITSNAANAAIGTTSAEQIRANNTVFV